MHPDALEFLESEGGWRDLRTVSSQGTRLLEGALFPLTREQLVWVARENEAPAGLLSWFYRLPDCTYRNLDQVEQVLRMAVSESESSWARGLESGRAALQLL